MINNTFSLSVVICTHNPRRDFLERTLDALRKQTSPLDEWELILIDNASSELVKNHFDLSWHPNERHVREDKLGIVQARIRGMKEAKAELILYVDDDNLLAPDYIEKGLRKSKEWPILGCWGGQLLPEFESEPPEWTKQWWCYLAILPLKTDLWTNLHYQYGSTPTCAGMFIRRKVWEAYLDNVARDSNHMLLGRKGDSVISGEDTDLALCACDLGLGVGRFKNLELTHIIPPERLTEEYLVRLVEGIFCSTVILEALRGKFPPVDRRPLWQALLQRFSAWRLPHRNKIFYLAEIRGRKKALEIVNNFRNRTDNESVDTC